MRCQRRDGLPWRNKFECGKRGEDVSLKPWIDAWRTEAERIGVSWLFLHNALNTLHLCGVSRLEDVASWCEMGADDLEIQGVERNTSIHRDPEVAVRVLRSFGWLCLAMVDCAGNEKEASVVPMGQK